MPGAEESNVLGAAQLVSALLSSGIEGQKLWKAPLEWIFPSSPFFLNAFKRLYKPLLLIVFESVF